MSQFTLTRDDVEPLLEGLAILGTGGGGNPNWGRMILEWETDFPLLHVTRDMGELIGRRIDAMAPFEAGGLNSPIVLTLAARMGIAAIDGDALGRSAPETQMTSWHRHGVEITPMPLADSYGNIVVVSKAVEPTYVDEIGRIVVTKGGHLGANNHHPMTGIQLKQTTVPGTFSRALALGRAVHAARAEGGDPVGAAAGLLGARPHIFGRIESLQEEERLIYLLEPKTGRGLMSIELSAGHEITLLGAPAHPRLRAAATTETGRKAFSPARFGHPDLSYRPMEDLLP